MTYTEKLYASKQHYPFDRWQKGLEFGLEQYTRENCDRARQIFDDLIDGLNSFGADASEADKLGRFKTAVLALNDLNEELGECFIETSEREDLCELFDEVCRAAGMNPTDYGDGEGPASEWRDW
ncbi:MAG: hypothetical protein AAFX44_02855 [Pseudomonadota bacterium]